MLRIHRVRIPILKVVVDGDGQGSGGGGDDVKLVMMEDDKYEQLLE